jgi:hypothetical protein
MVNDVVAQNVSEYVVLKTSHWKMDRSDGVGELEFLTVKGNPLLALENTERYVNTILTLPEMLEQLKREIVEEVRRTIASIVVTKKLTEFSQEIRTNAIKNRENMKNGENW